MQPSSTATPSPTLDPDQHADQHTDHYPDLTAEQYARSGYAIVYTTGPTQTFGPALAAQPDRHCDGDDHAGHQTPGAPVNGATPPATNIRPPLRRSRLRPTDIPTLAPTLPGQARRQGLAQWLARITPRRHHQPLARPRLFRLPT